MSDPSDSAFTRFMEDQRREAEKETLSQTDKDFEFQNRLVDEQANRQGATIHFIPVSTERDPNGPFQSAGVDPLDGDILDPQFRGGSPDEDDRVLNFKCLIQHEPPRQLLKLYGVDEQREVVFWLPWEAIQKVPNLVSEWRPNGADIGDLFIWDGTWYQGWNVYRDKYFGQRSRAHYIVAFCDRYRHNSVPTEDVPEDCTTSGLF